jgi:WD40 repeat protein
MPLASQAALYQPKLVATLDKDFTSPVRFSPDGKLLAALNRGPPLWARFWETDTWHVVDTLKLPDLQPCLRFAFTPDNKFLQIAMSRWWLWDVPSRRIIKTHQERWQMPAVAVSADGKALAWSDSHPQGNGDYAITVWDLVGDKTIANFRASKWVQDLAFSPDGHTLAAVGGYDSGCYWLWNLQLRRLVAADNKYGPYRLIGLSFSPDGRFLALVGGEEGFRLCDPETGKLLPSWHINFRTTCITFSTDGLVLVAGGGTENIPGLPGFPRGQLGEVRFWEVLSGKEIYGFHAHRDMISYMALSPDGRLLAVTSEAILPGGDAAQPSPVKIWDVSRISGSPIHEKPPTLSSEIQRQLWNDLASEDALRALTAVRRCIQAGTQAVSFLDAHLQTDRPCDHQRIEQLIAELDSDVPSARQAASTELGKILDQAESAIRRAQDRKPSPESRRRIEDLLKKLSLEITSPAQLRTLRALAALERIGTTEATRVLERLASGASESRLTREAKASLARIGKQRIAKPQ